MNEEQKRTESKRSHERSPDQTCISLSLDKATLKLVEEMAAKTGRTRSGFIRWVLRRALSSMNEPPTGLA